MTAIVCNCYFNGLNCIQDLGRRGVDVKALDSIRNVGTVSRYADFHRVPNPLEDEAGFVDDLEALAAGLDDEPVVLPTNDHWASALARHRDRLDDTCRPCVASEDVVELLLHKGEFYEWAAARDYPVPATWPATAPDRVPADAFPLVAKPDVRRISGDDTANRETVERMNDERLSVLESRADLDAFVADHPDSLSLFVLQEFVRGRSDEMYTVGVYADRDHDILGRFEGRKVRGYPPDSGDCRVGQAERVPDELVSVTERLVDDLGYHGIAEVEFKRDSETGAFRLIEVNPRSWSWVGITTAAGVGLPWLAYADLAADETHGVESPPRTQTVPDGGVRWAKPLDDLANAVHFNAASGHDDWAMSPGEWWRDLTASDLVVAGFAVDDPVPAAVAGALEGRRLVKEGVAGARSRLAPVAATFARGDGA